MKSGFSFIPSNTDICQNMCHFKCYLFQENHLSPLALLGRLQPPTLCLSVTIAWEEWLSESRGGGMGLAVGKMLVWRVGKGRPFCTIKHNIILIICLPIALAVQYIIRGIESVRGVNTHGTGEWAMHFSLMKDK